MPSRGPERAPISVLLVDDHALVRQGFRRMLEDDPRIRVVGEAGDGPEAIDVARHEKPDVIVMDYALPSMNGALAAKKILAEFLETAQLVAADFELDEKQRSVTLTEAGNEHLEQLLTAEGVLKGGTLYDAGNVTIVHHITQALRAHKLKGKLAQSWACSAGYDLRIVFQFVHHLNKEAVLLEAVGTHDEVY